MKKLYCAILFLILTATSKAQTYAWTKTFGGNNVEYALTVATDPTGNVFIGGTFAYDSIDMDPSVDTAFLHFKDGDDIYLAKYDADGNYMWAHTFNTLDNETNNSTVTDATGSVYITGFFQSTIDFDPSPAVANLVNTTGTNAIYLAKYDQNGNYLWAKGFDGPGIDASLRVNVDASNNVYITGAFENNIDFDPSSSAGNHTSTALRDIYVAKFDPSGNFLWSRSVAGTGDDLSRELIISDSGYVYIAGAIGNTADFDPSSSAGTVTAIGGGDIFFAKYDSLGNYIWAKIIGSAFPAEDCFGLGVDPSGNIYISGPFYKPFDFDPSSSGTTTLTPTGSLSDIYFAKYNSNGNFIMANKVGGTGNDFPYDLKIDPAGYFYLTGYFKNTVDFDPGTGITNATATGTSEDIFLAKYDLSGNFQWVKNAGGTGDDFGIGIALSNTGDVYFTGTFNNAFDFNPGSGTDSHTSNGGQDIFLTKYQNPATSIETISQSESGLFKIYPNPANNILYCETSQNTQLYIYNSSGALVLNLQLSSGKQSLDISFLVPGIYLVRSNEYQEGMVLVKQ